MILMLFGGVFSGGGAFTIELSGVVAGGGALGTKVLRLVFVVAEPTEVGAATGTELIFVDQE